MVFAYVVALSVSASLAWMILARRRGAQNLEMLLNHLKPSACVEVPQDPNQFERQREIDDDLWRAIRGARGIREMMSNSGILLTIALRMEQEFGESATEQHRHTTNLARMLRISLVVSLLEAAALKCLPNLPVPRLISRFAFEQYREMCSSVRAMIEYQHPALVETFDRVI